MSLRHPPRRGQHLRPGQAGSAVFLAFGRAGFMPRGSGEAQWKDLREKCRQPMPAMHKQLLFG
ncbi:hypothetical protein B0E49_04805 [Polaromonas sp. C04]|nr:hypothetical protein B0E49_04805 [Polaromonas sp. C04]